MDHLRVIISQQNEYILMYNITRKRMLSCNYLIPVLVAASSTINRLPHKFFYDMTPNSRRERISHGHDDDPSWQSVGMDSDVWKSELSVFVSAKNVNMDIRICICF
jgi:hypothetical protein